MVARRARLLFVLLAISTCSLLLFIAACGGGGTSNASSTPPPTPTPTTGWTRSNNASGTNQPVYGTKGVASSSNTPGVRSSSVAWTDSSGNFWLYGGMSVDLTSTQGEYNDLWEFNPTTKQWTWVSGQDAPNNSAVGCGFGQVEIPSTTNTPGLRVGAAGGTDSNGNLWLYGGSFHNTATQSSGTYADLWKFSPTDKTWTCFGTSAVNLSPQYGTQGVAGNGSPGSRQLAVAWIDSNGHFWLFGGSGATGTYSDLWEFDSATVQWTWVSGSSSPGQPGVFGTQGVASASNRPGARNGAVGWKDSAGNLWFFGGESVGASVTALNDLWEFNIATQQWTWVSGNTAMNQPGVYGSQGVASASNVPGARYFAVSWTDSSGNFWLFGGEGFDATGVQGELGDLWKFSPATKQWTWVAGSSSANPSTGSSPGGRDSAVGWRDSSGNLWLYGGYGYGNGTGLGLLNDLWRYQP